MGRPDQQALGLELVVHPISLPVKSTDTKHSYRVQAGANPGLVLCQLQQPLPWQPLKKQGRVEGGGMGGRWGDGGERGPSNVATLCQFGRGPS